MNLRIKRINGHVSVRFRLDHGQVLTPEEWAILFMMVLRLTRKRLEN
jgi:hypothetical protein